MRKIITAAMVMALLVLVFKVSRWAGTTYWAECDKAAGRSVLAWGKCLGARQACETVDSQPCIDLQNSVCKQADRAHEVMLDACEGMEP